AAHFGPSLRSIGLSCWRSSCPPSSWRWTRRCSASKTAATSRYAGLANSVIRSLDPGRARGNPALKTPAFPPWKGGSRPRLVASLPREITQFFQYADYVFTLIFFLEFALRVIADGIWFTPQAYFKNPWNVFD